MTQAELARRIGISQAVLSHWEKGDRGLNYEKVFKIEAALGLAHGAIGRTAGFVEDSEDDDNDGLVKVLVYDRHANALDAAGAAAALGLGVVLDNRTEVLDPDGVDVADEWVLVLRREPPLASLYDVGR